MAFLLISLAVPQVADRTRDSWIGWTNEKRARNLQLVVNNSRFLILPWVRVRYLASTILSLCAQQLPLDWERLYGYRPLLLETLVDAHFRGTSYRASNWTYLARRADVAGWTSTTRLTAER